MKVSELGLYRWSTLAIGLSIILPKELLFVTAFIFVLFFLKENTFLFKKAVKVFKPLLIVFIVGVIHCFDNSARDILRDIFLFTKIGVYFFVGVIASRYFNDFDKFARIIIYFAFAYALLHLYMFYSIGASIDSLDTLRSEIGTGNLIEAFGLSVFLVGLFESRVKLRTPTIVAMILVISVSVMLYYSRSLYISMVIFLLFLRNIVDLRTFRIRVNPLYVVIGLAIVGTISIVFFSSSEVGGASNWLLNKFGNIPNELFWSSEKNVIATEEDINLNWRGYESFQGVNTWLSGGLFRTIVGHGWGALVDLGLVMRLGNDDFEQIPILHNGYVMLLVKSGIGGAFFYLVFLYRMSITNRLESPQTSHVDCSSTRKFNQLLTALCILAFLNTFTITGLFNESDIFTPTMLGFCWAFVKKRID